MTSRFRGVFNRGLTPFRLFPPNPGPCAGLPRAGLGYLGARATLAQVFGVLFEVTHLLGQAGPRRGRDQAEALDNHAGSCQLALELVFNAMVRQLVVIPADQDETRQVAAMGL